MINNIIIFVSRTAMSKNKRNKLFSVVLLMSVFFKDDGLEKENYILAERKGLLL